MPTYEEKWTAQANYHDDLIQSTGGVLLKDWANPNIYESSQRLLKKVEVTVESHGPES